MRPGDAAQDDEGEVRDMFCNDEMRYLEGAACSRHLLDSASTYLNLRQLFSDSTEPARKDFKRRFSSYYGLGHAGLTSKWKDQYFELLFGFDQIHNNEPYYFILLKLYDIPRHQGDKALQFSFVSKLIAFHDESRPLWDSNVRKFFGLGPPEFGSPEFRISGFVRNLNEIAKRYDAWTQDERFAKILLDIRNKKPELASCHNIRICDFLVHNAGAT